MDAFNMARSAVVAMRLATRHSWNRSVELDGIWLDGMNCHFQPIAARPIGQWRTDLIFVNCEARRDFNGPDCIDTATGHQGWARWNPDGVRQTTPHRIRVRRGHLPALAGHLQRARSSAKVSRGIVTMRRLR
jgi:hypothetical protein